MSKIVPKQVLEDIRFRSDIVDVVGSYITLKRAGSTFRALCPFHKEKTPSFHVNPQKQIFHCFGCGEGGDVFGFLMKHEGMDFMGAVRMLADRAGVQIEMEEGGEGASDKQALYKIHEEVARFYQRCLEQMKSAAPARAYLEQRQLTGDTAEAFLIGYAPDRWDAVIQWGERNHFSKELLEKAGLILQSSRPDSQGRHYDRFRDRIMFPIRDEQSRVIGFSGRAMKTDTRTAKYVNSPETPLFKKSRILYALEKARKPIVDAREAIVCEGQVDVIRCHQLGFTRAVAAQGTAFTEDHARILRRYADSVVLVFDSDHAGQDAAVKTAGVFLESGLAVRVAALPEGEDPDDYLRESGADAFQTLLDASVSAVSFQIDVQSSREEVSSEVGVMRVAQAVLATILRSPNAVQRAALLREAAEKLDLPPEALESDLRRAASRSRYTRREKPEETPATRVETVRPQDEVALCEHLAHLDEEPDILPLIRKYLPVKRLTDENCRRVATACVEAWQTDSSLQEVLREDAEAGEDTHRFAAAIQSSPSKINPDSEFSHQQAVRDIILSVWRRRLRNERSELGRKMAESPSAELAHRHSQLTLDLDSLKTWDEGAAVIELELET